MNAREIMSQNVACCVPETPLPQVAKLMIEHDCGAIPVVDDFNTKVVIGIVTDRDIVTRTLPDGKNPVDLKAADCMTLGVATVSDEADLRDICNTMEALQVRRVPVLDEKGACLGVISQADLAQSAPDAHVAELVREVSAPSPPLKDELAG